MIDHSQCSHPSTKAARAACRRRMQQPDKMADFQASPHHDFLVWIEHLALDLMAKHGLFEQGWYFAWDRAVKRFGCCNWTKRRLSLSRVLAPTCTPEEIRNTILHEIAHALAGHQQGDSHGWMWRQTAIRIGARPERCMDVSNKVMPKARYTLVCPNCGIESPRHRKTKKMENIACRKCCNLYSGGKYDPRFKFEVRTN